MKGRYPRKIVDTFLYLLLAYVLAAILIRALPYTIIKGWHFPFIKLEPFLYGAAALFIIQRAVNPSAEPEKFFTAPLDKSQNSQPLYQTKDYLICGAIFLFNIAYLRVIYDKNVPIFDEACILTVSERVLNGGLPYRDFFMPMTAASFYLNALIFRIFGTTVLVERLTTLILASLTASIFYLLARRGMSYFFSAGAALLFMTWQFPFWFQASYSWYAVSFSIMAFWLLGTTTRQERSKKRLVLVGILLGLVFISKQNTGVLITIAAVGYLFAERVMFNAREERSTPTGRAPGQGSFILWMRDSAMLFVGMLFPLALNSYVYADNGYLWAYLRFIFFDFLEVGEHTYFTYMPFSRFTDKRIMACLPPFVAILSLAYLLRKSRRNSFKPRDRFPLLLAVAAIFSLFTLYPRADFTHIVFTLWPTLALSVYWFQQSVVALSNRWPAPTMDSSSSPSLNSKLRSAAIVLLSSSIFLVFLIHRMGDNLVLDSDLTEIAARRGREIYGEGKNVAELNQVTQFIRSRSVSGRPGAIFSTNPLIYFLAETPNLAPFDWILSTGVRKTCVDEIIGYLESVEPRLIVLDKHFFHYPIPDDWGIIQGYVLSNYKLGFKSSGSRYLIFERNPAFQVDTKRERTASQSRSRRVRDSLDSMALARP